MPRNKKWALMAGALTETIDRIRLKSDLKGTLVVGAVQRKGALMLAMSDIANLDDVTTGRGEVRLLREDARGRYIDDTQLCRLCAKLDPKTVWKLPGIRGSQTDDGKTKAHHRGTRHGDGCRPRDGSRSREHSRTAPSVHSTRMEASCVIETRFPPC